MTVGVPLPDAPASVAARRVFSANGVVFTVADLARRASVGGRETPCTAGTPAQAEEQLRRSRGLLRADQLEAWLASWEISADDFRQWTADCAAGTSTATPWCALICSGAFDAVVAEVVSAAAAACELGSGPVDAASFDPTGWTARLVEARSTAEVLTSVIAAHRLDWTRLETVAVSALSRGVAEELRQQVLVDQVELAAAAGRAGYATATSDEVLAAVAAPAVRAALAGARAGELVGPVRHGEEWSLIQVVSRTEPSLEDHASLTRAVTAVRNDVIAHAVARHVVA